MIVFTNKSGFKLDNKNSGANSVDVYNIEQVFLQKVDVVAHVQCS